MFKLRSNTFKSELFNEKTFYKRFLKDLADCRKEVVIESPYITSFRMETFHQVFQGLLHKNIQIHLITRDPSDHEDEYFRHQSTNEILKCKELGINIVLLRGFHHRKLAIIDKQILWEGSLNILSYSKSLEIMRRIDSEKHVKEMIHFLDLKI